MKTITKCIIGLGVVAGLIAINSRNKKKDNRYSTFTVKFDDFYDNENKSAVDVDYIATQKEIDNFKQKIYSGDGELLMNVDSIDKNEPIDICIKYDNIPDLYNKLLEKYPEENYCSRESAFGRGLREGVITAIAYQKAKDHYGKLWNYCGD